MGINSRKGKTLVPGGAVVYPFPGTENAIISMVAAYGYAMGASIKLKCNFAFNRLLGCCRLLEVDIAQA
jgi:hypothetical protein